ncbi:unnamed protein product [Peronospora belbahrii]|uniref:RRM domain-containing protein n=1 Tax=Peronospora belbahrii TaxID=622444 RepID=A0AAU9L5N5_9STRA|nr:unnamed protein product [Peronospora belbahrii]
MEKRLESYHSLRAELYQIFQQFYPLTELMYIEWINDTRATTKGESIANLKTLYELARRDYSSVSITLQYLRFLNEYGDQHELERAIKRELKTLGTHFARGHEVWALCRELTAEKYQEMEQRHEILVQKEKAIRDLFYKQMQLPLDQNDLVMSEFRAWDMYNSLDTEASGVVFEEASKLQSKVFAPLMKKLRRFEARICAISGTEDVAALEQAWQQYLNFVKHRVAPLMASQKTDFVNGRHIVVGLYERAISALCLSPTLWANYLEYLEFDQMDADEEAEIDCGKLTVARKAVRNVPFDSSVWVELLVEMERKEDKPVQKISQFIRTNLLARSSPPMDQFHSLRVLFAWCDAIRRSVSSGISGKLSDDNVQQVESLVGGVFSECEQFISKIFPDFVEGKIRLAEYQAKCYWALMPPVEAPRCAFAEATKVSKLNELWEKTLRSPLGNQTATWIAYLKSIRRMNAYSTDIVRTLVFDKAVQRVTDAPAVLAETWLVFERENGDLKNYLRARQYHAKHYAITQGIAIQGATPIPTSMPDEGDKKTKCAKKRKAATEAKQIKGLQTQLPTKRAKLDANNVRGDTTDSMDVNVIKTTKRAEKKKVHEKLTNDHTLFLCNVSKDASKEDIEEMFNDIPTLKDVRLVTKTRGDRVKSRGMAYVQFTDDNGVETGLKKDGCLLHGIPLRVERSKPPVTSTSTGAVQSSLQEAGGFWKTDPLTLYVGDLNREGSKEQVTEEHLQTLLQQAMHSAGELVVVNRVCILKDRHGKLKNYGLVEVAKPSQVAFCLRNVAALKAKLGDQVTLKPSRFSIAHVLEQQKKQQKQKPQRKTNTTSFSNQDGAATKEGANAAHARPSTRLALSSSGSITSLMPRALRRKLATNVAKASKTEVRADDAPVIPKSNEDFRKMLFNQ